MKVQPLSSYPPPAYPNREQALRRPQLLLTLPQRWQRNRSACAALVSLTAMLLSSCTTDDHLVGPIQSGQTDHIADIPTPDITSMPAGIVAPLFPHGDGFGGFGCVSVAPPAFLSEGEAYEVIARAAKEAGLELNKPGLTLQNVPIPAVTLFPESQQSAVIGARKALLELDRQDSTGKVAFEFVSTVDMEDWRKDVNEVGPTYTSYAFAQTAEALREGLAQTNPPMAVGVFYDPGYSYNDDVKKIMQEGGYDNEAEMVRQLKELVKADLRAQVIDFLAWLKAQGIV